MKKQKLVLISGLAIASTVLLGCSTGQLANKVIAQGAADMAGALDKQKELQQENVKVVYGLYLGEEEVKKTNQRLPKYFDTVISVPALTGNIVQITEKLQALTGIAISVTDDALQQQSAQQTSTLSGTITSASGGQVASGTTTMPPPGSGVSTGQQTKYGALNQINIREFHGSIKDYLNVIGQKTGLSCKVQNGVAKLYELDTQEFILNTQPGPITSTLNVAAGGSGGSSSGSGSGSSGSSSSSGGATSATAGQVTTATSTVDPWNDTIAAIKQMVVSPRAVVRPIGISNSVVVTDTPASLRNISERIESINTRLGRRVDIFAKVYSIQISDSQNSGINWDGVYNWLGKSTSIQFNTGIGTQSASGMNTSLSFKINGASPWAGSNALFNALQTQGDVHELTNIMVSPLANHTAPVFDGRQLTYTSSSSITQNNNTTTTALQQGSINLGFSMSITPTIFDKNQIAIRYAVDLADLNNLTLAQSKDGSSFQQNPDTAKRTLQGDTKIRNGETFIITGIERKHADVTNNSLGSRNLWALGGTEAAKVSKNIIVIVMTAYAH